MIDLYTLSSASPNIRKASLMLEELGLPYVEKVVEKNSDGSSPEYFRLISPNGTVPTIVDHETGAVVFESGAILLYLAEKTGKLLPTELKPHGEVMKWLMFEVGNMGPAMGEIYHYMLKEPEELAEAVLPRYKTKVAGFCAILERQLDGRDYLCDDFSIADIALYPWTVALEDMADVNLADYPRLSQWAVRISQRAAARAAR
jgi:GST-like protein